MKLIENGYLRVGVIGSSESKKVQMLSAFDGLKFQEVRGFSSFEEVEPFLLQGKIHWVFSTFKDESGAFLCDFLDEIYSQPIGHPMVFSALVQVNETHFLPDAFARGLFSWHPDKGVAEYSRQSLWRLKRKVGQVNGLAAMIPYMFYRSYLKQKSMWDELVDLCEQMIRCYRYEDVIKLHLVEAYIRAGHGKKGKSLLREIEYFEPSLAGQIAEVRRNVLGEEPSKTESLAQRYQVKHAVIVQSSLDQRNSHREMLQEFGFERVDCFESGEDAWRVLAKEKVDLLLMDWKLEGLHGSCLLQRVKISSAWDFPVIVYADRFREQESQIINQYSVAQVLPTKASRHLSSMGISWCLVQSKEPTEALGIESKIFERLGKKDIARAYRYFEKYLKVSSRDPSKEKYLKAQIDLAERNYLDAKYLLMEANFDSKVNSIKIDTLMARCLLELGDFQGVLNLLKRIKKKSPQSILVLGILAKAYARLGDLENAAQVVDEALAIDRGHPWIRHTAAKVHLALDEMKAAKSDMEDEDWEPVTKDSNNLASVYFENKMQERGINLFKTLIDLIHGSKIAASLEPVLLYNLALSYSFQGDRELAKKHLEKCLVFKNSLVVELAREMKQAFEDEKSPDLFFYTFAIEDEHPYQELEEGQVTGEILNTGTEIDLDDRVFLRGLVHAPRALGKAS
ncbi:response regulator [Pseudobacteriovorax antillogorgiicola]|uniref:response regulator n=1 Tax=Pseudobacteriovorax antillogorgiicola TaxID=1513793 RepID=UPI0013565F52|nr:response regulator [Pseudobacteriovorax antillogorgiicola]